MTVYTALVGDCPDKLSDPTLLVPGVRYACFSDRPLRSNIWERIPVAPGDVWTARTIKLRHCAARPCLWVDAAFTLHCDPREFLEIPVAMFRHPDRTRIEDEGAEIHRLLHFDGENLQAQARAYRADGFTADVLSTTGFLWRRDDTRAFDELWHSELLRWGHPRDQMSVDYCAWKTGMTITYLPGTYRRNDYATFTKYRHRHHANMRSADRDRVLPGLHASADRLGADPDPVDRGR